MSQDNNRLIPQAINGFIKNRQVKFSSGNQKKDFCFRKWQWQNWWEQLRMDVHYKGTSKEKYFEKVRVGR